MNRCITGYIKHQNGALTHSRPNPGYERTDSPDTVRAELIPLAIEGDEIVLLDSLTGRVYASITVTRELIARAQRACVR